MKNTIGIVFGTFAPMHKGHIDLIQRSKRENDSVLVIVSGYEGDRGDNIGLNLQRRFRYIRETFHDDNLVDVMKLDETGLPPMPNGWTEWLDKIANETTIHDVKSSIYNGHYQEPHFCDVDRQEIIFYVSEREYKDELKKRGFETKFTERNFGISATLIRENPAKYWNAIAKPFRRHFSKNVLIVGSASNGKTSLAIDLGRYYSAPVSLEYSRHYQTKYNVRDDELQAKDYTNLLSGQYRQTQHLIDSNENRGLVIADTNSTVTKAYYDYYFPTDQPHQDAFNRLYELTADEEKWEAIIFVNPTGEYVNDGFRDMTMADNEIRNQFTNHLKELIKQYHPNVPMFEIGGDYLKNYTKAIELIDGFYQDF